MVVVNPNRVFAYGYPDINMVPGNSCGCSGSNVLSNSRGPFIGLSGVSSSNTSMYAIAAVVGFILLTHKVGKRRVVASSSSS